MHLKSKDALEDASSDDVAEEASYIDGAVADVSVAEMDAITSSDRLKLFESSAVAALMQNK